MSNSTDRRPLPVWLNSLPSARFDAQVKQELSRIRHQLLHPRIRKTVPHDPLASSADNAISNVRSRWQSQGTWRRVWGLDPRSTASGPLDAWPHEIQSEFPSSASRPYQQFHIEVMAELELIIAEMEHRRREVVDVVPFGNAVRNVRERWMQDGIWNPLWIVTPGTMWLHEQLPAACDPRLVEYATQVPQLRRDTRHLGEGQTHSARRLIPNQHAPDAASSANPTIVYANVSGARRPMLHHILTDAGNQYHSEALPAELPCQQTANATYMPPSDDRSEIPPTPLLTFLPTPQSATLRTEIQHPAPARVATPEVLRIPTPSAFMSGSNYYDSRLDPLQLPNFSRNCQQGQTERSEEQQGMSRAQTAALENGTREESCPLSPIASSEARGSSRASIKTDEEYFEARIPGHRGQAQLITTTGVECNAPEAEIKRNRRRRRSDSRKSATRSDNRGGDIQPSCIEICFSWGRRGRSNKQISFSWL